MGFDSWVDLKYIKNVIGYSDNICATTEPGGLFVLLQVIVEFTDEQNCWLYWHKLIKIALTFIEIFLDLTAKLLIYIEITQDSAWHAIVYLACLFYLPLEPTLTCFSSFM